MSDVLQLQSYISAAHSHSLFFIFRDDNSVIQNRFQGGLSVWSTGAVCVCINRVSLRSIILPWFDNTLLSRVCSDDKAPVRCRMQIASYQHDLAAYGFAWKEFYVCLRHAYIWYYWIVFNAIKQVVSWEWVSYSLNYMKDFDLHLIVPK